MSIKIVATEGIKLIRLLKELPTTLSHVLVKLGKAPRLFGIIFDND